MINQRFRNCIKLAKSLPGADINSDHNLVKVKSESQTKKNEEDKSQRTTRPRPTKTTRI